MNRDILKKAITDIKDIYSEKNDNKISDYIKLHITKNNIEIISFSDAVQVCLNIPCTNEIEETIGVKGRDLLKALKKIPKNTDITLHQNTDVNLYGDPNKLLILYGEFKHEPIELYKAKDNKYIIIENQFPEIVKDQFTIKDTYKFQSGALARLFKEIEHIIPYVDLPIYSSFASAEIEIKNDVITCTAISKERMTISSEASINNDLNVVLPELFINLIPKLLKNIDTDIVIKATERHIILEYENNTIATKKLDQRFPNYKRILDKCTDKKSSIDASELKKALICLCKKDESERVLFHFKTDELTLINDTGQVKINHAYEGDNYTLCLNGWYIRDYINALKPKTIDLNFSGDKSPVKITHKDNLVYFIQALEI